MIMRIVITITAVCLAISSLATATAEAEASQQKSAEVSETNVQNVVPEEAGINVTAIAARLINDYVTPTVCSYSPEFCAKHQLHESRGIQSYLATAGTLLAGVLGVIMTKITVLIALSLLSTVIGKLLLVYALFKSGSHHHYPSYKSAHHNAEPFVKYTKDKYYIKNTPSIHNHDVVVDSPSEYSSPYHAYSPSILDSSVHSHKLKGVSYY